MGDSIGDIKSRYGLAPEEILSGAIGLYGGTVNLQFDSGKHKYMLNGVEFPSVTTITGVLDKPALVPWACKMMAEELKATLASPVLGVVGQCLGALADLQVMVDAARRDREKMSERLKFIRLALEQNVNEITFENIITTAKGAHNRVKKQAGNIGTIAHDWVHDFLTLPTIPPMPVHPAVAAACSGFLDWYHQHNIVVLASERRIVSLRHCYAGTTDMVVEIDGQLACLDVKTSSGIWPEMAYQLAGYAIALDEENRFGRPIEKLVIVRLGKEPYMDVIDTEVKEFPDIDLYKEVFLACRTIYRGSKGR